jgi:hypothetical protein
MARLSVWIGVLLVAIGVGGYWLTNGVSATALIPVAFGAAIIMLGVYGRGQAQRRTAMHLAMGVAIVGLIGSFSGIVQVITVLAADGVDRQLRAAAVSRALMAGILMIYLSAGISSFLQARKQG